MGLSYVDTDLIEILDRFRFIPGDEYVSKATIWSIVIGIIAASFVIFTAVTSKKNMGLGITAGVMQILGAIGAQQASIQYWKADFFAYEVISGSSESNVLEQMMERSKEMILEMLPHILLMFMFSAFVLAAWIITLVYIIKVMAMEPKVFGIVALIVHIARFVFISPMNIYAPIMGIKLTEAVHSSYDAFVYIIYLIPALLIGAVGIMNFIKSLINKDNAIDAPKADIPAAEENDLAPQNVSVDD